MSLLCCGAAAMLCACGGGDDGEDPLAVYGGDFQVTELFLDQTGVSCPAPPADSENQVRITVKKNDFTAVFRQRWSKMVGQVSSDASFLAVNSEPFVDLSLQFTGKYQDQNNFQGKMRETFPGCTRQRTIMATRTGGTP